jgi:DNA-directed RNA polymerase specialized sigma24 family protein
MLDQFMDDGLQRYIKKTARANHWRVASWHTVEDLVQDGYMVAARCAVKYDRGVAQPGDKLDRRQFMGFFCRAFDNHINDLAKKRSRLSETNLSSFGVEQDADMETMIAAAYPEQATILLLLEQAPAPVKRAIRLILASDEPFLYSWLRLVRQGENARLVRSERPTRETSEQWIDRVVGNRGVAQMLRNYFLDHIPQTRAV